MNSIRKLFVLALISFSTFAISDDFLMTGIRYLDDKDIAEIPPKTSFEQLEKMFGKFTRADSYAIGWPKKHLKKLTDIEKWRRSYWFFYDRNENGRAKRPVTLKYVASLPNDLEVIDEPWISLASKMIVDWPLEHKGNLLINMDY